MKYRNKTNPGEGLRKIRVVSVFLPWQKLAEVRAMPALSFVLGCLLLPGLLLLGGCGNRYRPPYEIAPTTGSILYEDGTPLPVAISLQFWPQMKPVSPKEYPRPATAEVGPDGKFVSLTTWQFNDGIIPGQHKVQILSAEGRVLPPKILAAEYADNRRTPLLVEVKDDGQPIELRVPRPKYTDIQQPFRGD